MNYIIFLYLIIYQNNYIISKDYTTQYIQKTVFINYKKNHK